MWWEHLKKRKNVIDIDEEPSKGPQAPKAGKSKPPQPEGMPGYDAGAFNPNGDPFERCDSVRSERSAAFTEGGIHASEGFAPDEEGEEDEVEHASVGSEGAEDEPEAGKEPVGKAKSKGPGATSAVPPMPPDWDGGPVFFQWLMLGPLGESGGIKEYKIPGVADKPGGKPGGDKSAAASRGPASTDGTTRGERKAAEEERRRSSQEAKAWGFRGSADTPEDGEGHKAGAFRELMKRMDMQRDRSDFHLTHSAWSKHYTVIRDEITDKRQDLADGLCSPGEEPTQATLRKRLVDHKASEPDFDAFLEERSAKRAKYPSAKGQWDAGMETPTTPPEAEDDNEPSVDAEEEYCCPGAYC